MSSTQNRFDGLVNIAVTLTSLSGQDLSAQPSSEADPSDTPNRVEAVTVGVVDDALRVLTEDPKALWLHATTVSANFHIPDRVLRLVASIEVLDQDSYPYLLAMKPLALPEEIQRRNWVRTVEAIPVTVEFPPPLASVEPEASSNVIPIRSKTENPDPLLTETINLSAGGACIASPPGLVAGMAVHLTLRLPSGDELIEAEVIEVDYGLARLSFAPLNEGATTRVTKHVFDNLMSSRRSSRPRTT